MKLVFLLEEYSMRVTLEALLPKILPTDVQHLLIDHEGKRDLEISIPRKLRAWRENDVRFVIVHDQDSADCRQLKKRLAKLCQEAGRSDALIRIACVELESWFLGDLEAVAEAFDHPQIAALKDRSKFRNPDRLANASDELRKLIPRYQKVGGARAIAPLLDFPRNRSHSFQIFLTGLRRLVGQ